MGIEMYAGRSCLKNPLSNTSSCIEIVWRVPDEDNYTRVVFHNVTDLELLAEPRCFRIHHANSDICTFIPAENVIRIGKVLMDCDDENG